MNSVPDSLGIDTTFGFIDKSVQNEMLYNPVLISNEQENTMLRAIRNELRRSERFDFSVAFVGTGAIALLKQALLDFDGPGRIITGSYLGFNSPDVFRELLGLENVEVLVYPEELGAFHAKGYVFSQPDSITAIVGSSNLTRGALLENKEWNLRFSALPDGDVTEQLAQEIKAQARQALPLTEHWIKDYEARYARRPNLQRFVEGARPDSLEVGSQGAIMPNLMQDEALEQIEYLRKQGEQRAVVISATGTGKTILAALHVRASGPGRLLFVAHREQILDKAMSEFHLVIGGPKSDYGKFAGTKHELDRKYVFATVQSVTRSENLQLIPEDLFDYVIIDEVHRAGAESYQKLINYLHPQFLLGMTATPERTDDYDILGLFDHNVAYEIRLQQALESRMLVPFNYYGVTDYVDSRGTTVDDASSLARLIEPERVAYLVEMMETYGYRSNVRGLIFCSHVEEAKKLSVLLNRQVVNGRLLRTVALSGCDSNEYREEIVSQLELGELDYILTVDIFNEGIDIPCLNQIVMMRQTKSSIIFTQQLGRGLRKFEGKDHLRVLDFIGNYENNYLIPIALTGDSSLNKDVVRKKLIEANASGTIAGVSSINFDQIARQRVLDSLANTRLDSLSEIKRVFRDLEKRLGKPPRLMDFARFDAADPVVIATRQVQGNKLKRNYWTFLEYMGAVSESPGVKQCHVLNFLSAELMNGKRPQELLLLKELVAGNSLSLAEFQIYLRTHGLLDDRETLASVARVLSLRFFKEKQRAAYGNIDLVSLVDGRYVLDPDVSQLLEDDSEFKEQVLDVIETGLYRSKHRYDGSQRLTVGERYSRKDVCRLLAWEKNEESTVYGYKVDRMSGTCPIFVTYHKDADVTASTNYEDEFIDPGTMRWFTRSRRTLQSNEVKAIVDREVPLHLFAKKDDAEGTDFYYLGEAVPREPVQEQMPSDDGDLLNVVTMKLDLERPLD
ncbi:DUF3427 domain-containing protein, partial [Ancrocorticia populi]|uniref:DUF3427 domain-containing protein n=1 Tax=Ancrocorticia populi TaxID=2175228 RepID=UPI003F99BCF3